MDGFALLAGRAVEQIWIWSDFRLVLTSTDPAEPDIPVDVRRFTCVDSAGEAHAFDTERSPEQLGPALGLLKQSVANASATDGTLSISFINGASIRCEPDERFEAWQIAGAEGGKGLIVCMPGGELAVWDFASGSNS